MTSKLQKAPYATLSITKEIELTEIMKYLIYLYQKYFVIKKKKKKKKLKVQSASYDMKVLCPTLKQMGSENYYEDCGPGVSLPMGPNPSVK